MRYYFGFLLLLVMTTSVFSQTAHTGTAETAGPCSPAVTGTNNQFTITCSGVSDKLGAQLVELMNRVATNQLDAQAVMSKLDGCLAQLKVVKEQQEPWHLTALQKAQLQSTLETTLLFPSTQAKITISVLPSDHNANLFGIDLMEVLKQAKWITDNNGMTSDFTINPQVIGFGVVVTHRDFPEAAVLINALRSVGLNPQVFVDDKKERVKDDNTIQIIVGAKPVAETPGVNQ